MFEKFFKSETAYRVVTGLMIWGGAAWLIYSIGSDVKAYKTKIDNNQTEIEELRKEVKTLKEKTNG